MYVTRETSASVGIPLRALRRLPVQNALASRPADVKRASVILAASVWLAAHGVAKFVATPNSKGTPPKHGNLYRTRRRRSAGMAWRQD